MAEISLSEVVVPSVDLGPENPHAQLWLPTPLVGRYEGRDLPMTTCLPYRLQDGYGARTLFERSYQGIR